MPLLWDHMTHAALGILDITLVARDEVYMDMKDTLPGRLPYVNADIVTIRLEFLVQQPALLGDQPHAGIDLFGRQVEKAGDMATWDNQGMARAHCVAITRTVGEFMLQRYAPRIFAEQAWVVRIALFFCFFYRRQFDPLVSGMRYWRSPAILPYPFAPRNALNRVAAGHAKNIR